MYSEETRILGCYCSPHSSSCPMKFSVPKRNTEQKFQGGCKDLARIVEQQNWSI